LRAIAACAATLAFAIVTLDAYPRLIVGPNVLVSGANGEVPHSEVVACASLRSPTLLVASMASAGVRAQR
jgi:hypothetical protein